MLGSCQTPSRYLTCTLGIYYCYLVNLYRCINIFMLILLRVTSTSHFKIRYVILKLNMWSVISTCHLWFRHLVCDFDMPFWNSTCRLETRHVIYLYSKVFMTSHYPHSVIDSFCLLPFAFGKELKREGLAQVPKDIHICVVSGMHFSDKTRTGKSMISTLKIIICAKTSIQENKFYRAVVCSGHTKRD